MFFGLTNNFCFLDIVALAILLFMIIILIVHCVRYQKREQEYALSQERKNNDIEIL